MDHQSTTERITPTKNNNKVLNFVLLSLLVFVGLKALFLFTSYEELWGVNQLHYLPGFLGIILIIIPLVIIYFSWISKNQIALRSAKEIKTESKKDKIKSDLPLLAILCLFFGILFLVFQIAWPFLGDGSVFVGYLFNFHAYGKMPVWWTEAPSMYLEYGIYYLKLFFGGKASSFFPFTVISLISGIIFVATSFRFAKNIDKNFWIQSLSFGLLLSAGGTLFFFGYMENYALQYSCVLIYCYFSYQFIKNQRSFIGPVLVLLLCIILHLQNILLLPSLIFLYSLRNYDKKEESDKRKSVFRSIIIVAPFLLAIYLYLQWHPISVIVTDPKNPFIPLFSLGHFSYSLFSAQHLLDILNEHSLLAGSSICIIIGCTIAAYRSIRWADPYILFLLLCLFYIEAFLIGGNLVFGMARDWDVCASLGIFISLLSIILLKQVLLSNTDFRKIVPPILAVSLCTIFSWIALNINIDSASKRYEDILEVYTPKIEKVWAQFGYENLRKYYQGLDPESEIRINRKMIEINPRPTEVSGALTAAKFMGSNLSQQGRNEIQKIIKIVVDIPSDSLLAQEVFNTIRLGKSHSGASITLGDFYEDGIIFLKNIEVLAIESALTLADQFIAKHPRLPYGYELRGYIMLYSLKDFQGSLPFFEKAVSLDSSRTRSYLSLGILNDELGNRDQAKLSFRKMFKLDSTWFEGLKIYTLLLTGKELTGYSKNLADTTDLYILQSGLNSIIQAPSESSVEWHIAENNNRIMEARKILKKVEQRLKEFRAIQ